MKDSKLLSHEELSFITGGEPGDGAYVLGLAVGIAVGVAILPAVPFIAFYDIVTNKL